jgi:hypothetical protein
MQPHYGGLARWLLVAGGRCGPAAGTSDQPCLQREKQEKAGQRGQVHPVAEPWVGVVDLGKEREEDVGERDAATE